MISSTRTSRLPALVLLLAGLALQTATSPTPAAGRGAAEISDEVLAEHPEVVAIRQQVAENPARAALHNDLANMYAQRGWDDLAIASYRTAVDLDPDFYVAWTNLGTVYWKTGQSDAARRAFQRAIDLQPRAALAHYNLGVIHERQGRYEEALESYKTAVTLDPSMLDPGVNPQIVNNEHEVSIRLLRYLETIGSASLPLTDSPSGESRTDPTPAAPGLPEPDSPPAGPADDAGDEAVDEPLATGKPHLGGLKMYRGRAAERLHERAERSRETEDPVAPAGAAAGDEPSTS